MSAYEISILCKTTQGVLRVVLVIENKETRGLQIYIHRHEIESSNFKDNIEDRPNISISIRMT